MPESTSEPVALVAGGTGLIGRHLVDALLESDVFGTVRLLSRRPLPDADPRVDVQVIDFEALVDDPRPIPAHTVFCALGTTIKQAGSQEAFRRVDYDYALAVARAGLKGGARHLVLVTALGADADSAIFYNRVKGELEDAVLALPFEAHTILQPSLLLGDRDERRPAERLGQLLSGVARPLMVGPLRQYRPIHARTVAEAMVRAGESFDRGVRIADSEEIPSI